MRSGVDPLQDHGQLHRGPAGNCMHFIREIGNLQQPAPRAKSFSPHKRTHRCVRVFVCGFRVHLTLNEGISNVCQLAAALNFFKKLKVRWDKDQKCRPWEYSSGYRVKKPQQLSFMFFTLRSATVKLDNPATLIPLKLIWYCSASKLYSKK